MKVVFRNLEKSDLARDVVRERLAPVLEKFPALADGRPTVTITMHNSPLQPGPDLFSVKLVCGSGSYRGLVLEKTAATPYLALAELVDHLLERLKRFADRRRGQRVRDADARHLAQLRGAS